MDDVEREFEKVATLREHRDPETGRLSYDVLVDTRVVGLAHKLSSMLSGEGVNTITPVGVS